MTENERAAAPSRGPRQATGGSRPSPMPQKRRPYHIVTFVGASAVTYAMALGVVAHLQVDADKQRISDLDPMDRSIQMLSTHHDGMDSATTNTRQTLEQTVANYNRLVDRLSRFEDRLTTVGGTVDTLNTDLAAQIAALQQPTSGPSSGSARVSRPAAGSAGGSGGGGTVAAKPKPAPAPIVAPPPAPAPTPHATTKTSTKP